MASWVIVWLCGLYASFNARRNLSTALAPPIPGRFATRSPTPLSPSHWIKVIRTSERKVKGKSKWMGEILRPIEAMAVGIILFAL